MYNSSLDGSMTITDSTIADNSASSGGGMFTFNSPLDSHQLHHRL